LRDRKEKRKGKKKTTGAVHAGMHRDARSRTASEIVRLKIAAKDQIEEEDGLSSLKEARWRRFACAQ
jgi:hypothetical protein